jgi:hypothetical protein
MTNGLLSIWRIEWREVFRVEKAGSSEITGLMEEKLGAPSLHTMHLCSHSTAFFRGDRQSWYVFASKIISYIGANTPDSINL